MVRAGFGIRLGAALIDAVILYALLFLGALLTVPVMVFAAARSGNAPPPYAALTGLSVGAVFCVAYTLTEVFGRRSAAKRILKLRIAAADYPYGDPLSWRLWLRWAIKYSPMLSNFGSVGMMYWMLARGTFGQGGMPPALLLGNMVTGLLFLAVLGGFLPTLARGRQALHDLLAGTVVVRPGEEPQGFAPIIAAPAAAPAAPPPLNAAGGRD
jgi:uncharacterized RDD family membrane protein YckC